MIYEAHAAFLIITDLVVSHAALLIIWQSVAVVSYGQDQQPRVLVPVPLPCRYIYRAGTITAAITIPVPEKKVTPLRRGLRRLGG